VTATRLDKWTKKWILFVVSERWERVKRLVYRWIALCLVVGSVRPMSKVTALVALPLAVLFWEAGDLLKESWTGNRE
jgi:hypothetical protein